MSYSNIAVIYNPKSTGPSKAIAEQFIEEIRTRLPNQKLELLPTEYAGHAEKLAYSIAKSYDNPLIISSSGDGGYNEVINGALRAQNEGHSITTGLLPAGNANDHHRTQTSGNFIYRVAKGDSQQIDVLKISSASNNQDIERYAHSYIGFGITSKIGRELNKTKLNPIKEILLVSRKFLSVKSSRLRVNGKVRRYDSVIFSNIKYMSKYIQVAKDSRVDDGKFEITATRRRHKLKLVGIIFKATLGGIKEDMSVSEYSFETTRKTLVQTDGEIITLDPKSRVTISSEKQALACIV